MKYFIYILLGCCLVIACTKDRPVQPASNPKPIDSPATPGDTMALHDKATRGKGSPEHPIVIVPDSFITYLIKSGNNFCEGNTYPPTNLSFIRFRAILDSSCIYTTQDPSNQEDINKLYGISDCNSHHQTNSARVGWNWTRDSMRIHAYCYAGTQRSYKELGVVSINKAFECKITILPGKYVFELNGKTDTMTRGCNDAAAKGYKLLPYFGGNEPSPHDMKVKIREM
jgi:hypothetical protein